MTSSALANTLNSPTGERVCFSQVKWATSVALSSIKKEQKMDLKERALNKANAKIATIPFRIRELEERKDPYLSEDQYLICIESELRDLATWHYIKDCITLNKRNGKNQTTT